MEEAGEGGEAGRERSRRVRPPWAATRGTRRTHPPRMTAAAALGQTPAGDYAMTVAAEVDWLTAAARGGTTRT